MVVLHRTNLASGVLPTTLLPVQKSTATRSKVTLLYKAKIAPRASHYNKNTEDFFCKKLKIELKTNIFKKSIVPAADMIDGFLAL